MKHLAVIQKEFSDGLHEKVIQFFHENPNPPDSLLHDWAEKNGFKPDEVETEAYKLVTKYVNFLLGGKSNEKGGKTKNDVDPEQLKIGSEIELEHGPDKDTAEKIALDHLTENSTYYQGANVKKDILQFPKDEIK